MIPINTRIEDIESVLAFMSRQVGWIAVDKAKKSLGAKLLDDRKIAAMAYLGLIDRDGNNLKATAAGMRFNGGERVETLREGLLQTELYRSTVEWLHFGAKTEVTAVEVGQYWQAHHQDNVGDVNGDRLKDGAVFFFRVADAAKLGTLTIGRGGKETRFTASPVEISGALDAVPDDSEPSATPPVEAVSEAVVDTNDVATPLAVPASVVQAPPTVSVSTSPSVHVNVEIHIAADATAETVKEIFRNMARYVLDKHVDD